MDILKRIIRWVRDRRNIGKQQTTSCCVQAEEACVATDAEPTKYHLTKSSHEVDTLKDYAERNPNNSRTESIMRICRERGVEELVHFTSIHNLATIFEYGLLSLDDLERLEIKYDYNDEDRLEGMPNSICLSVSFPNYKMFFKYRKSKSKNYPFVVISLCKSILWELSCIFCPTNAAQKHISALLKDSRLMGILSEPEAFEDMFSEKLCRIKTGTGGYVGVPQRLLRLLREGWTGEYIQRAALDIPLHYTTDPQAEVLCLENIKHDYIKKVYVEDEKVKRELVSHYSNLPVAIEVKSEFFGRRKDYKHWKDFDWV